MFVDENNNHGGAEAFARVATFYCHARRWFLRTNNSTSYIRRHARRIRAATSMDEIATIVFAFQGIVETIS